MSRKPTGPGPAAYSLPSTFGYDRCDARKQRNPQYSFGRRSTAPEGKAGPGPAEYKVGQITRFGNARGLQFSMMRKGEMNKPNSIHLDK